MNLTASVLTLNRADVKALRVTDPYSLHRVVYSLYKDVRSAAEKRSSQPSGILYADQGGDFRGRSILLLANRPPADRVMNEQGQRFGEIRSKPITAGFLDHERYRFKTIVNPTCRMYVSKKLTPAKGKLVPIKGREAVAQWFLARASQSWGFEAVSKYLQVDKIEILQFQDKAQRSITLAQAHVQGQLIVTDRERFHHSFIAGIGRGRAFGCGLLQIVPLIDNPFA